MNAITVALASSLISAATCLAEKPSPDFQVHNLFQSNMVLQRDRPVAVWGWGAPGERVRVSFAGNSSSTEVAENRSWKVTLPAMPASAEPRTMTVTCDSRIDRFDNVLIGDVWVIGGQSNMQHPLSNTEEGQLEIVSAHFPEVRLLTVPPVIDERIKVNFPRRLEGERETGDWKVCSPKTVPPFSAIGYVFGRRLHMASKVPIGLIDVSRWGTSVEAWTPRTVLAGIGSAAVKAVLAEWEQKVLNFDPQRDLESRIARYKRHHPDGTEPPAEPGPGPQADQNHPGNCYNSFIAPISGLPVKGAIYHQGFNNARADAAEFYHAVFPEMIKAWRAAFRDPQMPFGIISLCTDGTPQTLDNFCESMMNHGIHVREAQYKTFLDFHRAGDRNVGFASSFNLRHDWYHPQKKIPAGERIARWALATQYGIESVQWKPPMVTGMELVEGTIHLQLDQDVTTEERGEVIVGFAVSGADKKYQPATAELLSIGIDSRGRPQHNRKVLVLSSPHVPAPIHYRYAWGRNPMGNLRAEGNDRRHIAFATQRSDDWSYWEVPYLELPADQRDNRQSIRNIREVLRFIDLERRVKDARALLETEERVYLELRKTIGANSSNHLPSP
jgi:sialate O-acetylesterase